MDENINAWMKGDGVGAGEMMALGELGCVARDAHGAVATWGQLAFLTEHAPGDC